jgi:hypothetical protein
MNPISTSSRALTTVTHVILTATGSITEIDDEISCYQHILLSIPRSHPLRFSYAQLLGSAYYNRHIHSRQKKDLDTSILSFTEAILIAPPSGWGEDGQNIVQIFFFLAHGLLVRLDNFDQPGDAQHCAAYFRYLRSQPLETFGTPIDDFKVFFLSALASQLKWGFGDVSNIDEMTVHFRELLAFNDLSPPLIMKAIRALASSNNMQCRQTLSSADSDKVIECLREARRRFDSREVVYHLVWHLSRRFSETHSVDDYKEAMAMVDAMVAPDSNGDCPGLYLENAACISAALTFNRCIHNASPEYVEEAIFHCRAFLRICSADGVNRHQVAAALKTLMGMRSSLFGVTNGLQGARPHNTEVTDLPSYSYLVTSLLARSTGESPWWMDRGELYQHIDALNFVVHTKDIVVIRDAMKYCELLLASIPPSNPFMIFPAIALGKLFFCASLCTDIIDFLNRSVDLFRGILRHQIAAKGRQFNVIDLLILTLSRRIELLGDKKDFDEVMLLHSVASKDTNTSARDRFPLSCDWAINARFNRHHSTSTAYETAISLMEESLLFAPTLETQHFHLVSLRKSYEKLPLDIASYEIGRGQLKRAIQALERGRGLLWSEMRGLRTSIDQLAVDSDLAKEFTTLNRELEAVSAHLTGNSDGWRR